MTIKLQVRINRQWFVAGENAHYFWIVSRLNGLALAIAGANRNPGAHVVLWRKMRHDSQFWYEHKRYGMIRSKLNDLCLEAQGNLYRTQDRK